MPADRRASLPPPTPKDWFRIYRVCVVCLGNICRSPMAETLIRAELDTAGLSERVSVESAGTGDWHLGEQMDRRARAELASRGYDGSAHRARQIDRGWFEGFDLVLAMDASNLRGLEQMARGLPGMTGRIRLFRSFDPDAPAGAQVPDPYGGGPDEFAAAFELMRVAAEGLVAGLARLLTAQGTGSQSKG